MRKLLAALISPSDDFGAHRERGTRAARGESSLVRVPRGGVRRHHLSRVLIAGLLAVGFTGAAGVQATAATRVDRQNESAIFADCHGSLPDGRRIRANLTHLDGPVSGRFDSAFVTLRDPDGTVLGEGFRFWSPESVWANGHLAVTVDVLRDWVDPVGQAAISFDYALGEAQATTHTIRNGNHVYVVRQSIANVTFTSVSLTFEGVPVASPTCSGQASEASWINTYPSREIYSYTAFVNPVCTNTNTRNDFLLIKSSEGLQFYVPLEQPEGFSTLSAPFKLTGDTWSGEVPLTGPEGAAGTLHATYSLTVTGPTTHHTEEFPEYGYTQRVDITPAQVHLVLSGQDVSAELSCAVELWDVVQKRDQT
jgi:hypothetical protein